MRLLRHLLRPTIRSLVLLIVKELNIMSEQIDRLTADIAALSDKVEVAVTMLETAAAVLKTQAADNAALADLALQIEVVTDKLNTAENPAPAPAPEPAPAPVA